MTKATDNEEFVKAAQAWLGVTVDGWAGGETLAAFLEKTGRTVLAQPTQAGEDPNDALLAVELERDEGFVPYAYQDSRGFWTIGIGRLIDKARGGRITREEALYLKRNDIARFKAELDKAAPWWRTLDAVRQRAVLNMTFNLGSGWITPGHPKAWPNTVKLIREGKYAAAADAILANKVWVGQVGDRARRIAEQIRTGK